MAIILNVVVDADSESAHSRQQQQQGQFKSSSQHSRQQRQRQGQLKSSSSHPPPPTNRSAFALCFLGFTCGVAVLFLYPRALFEQRSEFRAAGLRTELAVHAAGIGGGYENRTESAPLATTAIIPTGEAEEEEGDSSAAPAGAVVASATYVASFRDNFLRSTGGGRRPLQFVHNPKTGGTTVETVGRADGDVYWGKCMFPTNRMVHCQNQPPYAVDGGSWPPRDPWWHLPRQYFPLAGSDPYHDAGEIFLIVRDPYRRLLSEFYYTKGPKFKRKADSLIKLYDPRFMNDFVTNQVNNRHAFRKQWNHFAEQYAFAVLEIPLAASTSKSAAGSEPQETKFEVRVADHVLRFENLNDEFDRLMLAYGLAGIELTSPAARTANSADFFLGNNAATKNRTKLEPDAFDGATNRLIRDAYRNDFIAFGYEPILTADEKRVPYATE